MNQIYDKGMALFNAGDYTGALTVFQEMLNKGAAGPGLESVLFTMGAAQFNLKDYPSAIATFERYTKEFPTGSRIVQVKMATAQCQFMSGNKQKAADMFKALSSQQSVGEQATLAAAVTLDQLGKKEDAVTILKVFLKNGVKSEATAKGALVLATAYADTGRLAEASEWLEYLQRQIQYVDNVVRLNALAFKIGDELIKQKKPKEALRVYANIRDREEVIALQKERIKDSEEKCKRNALSLGVVTAALSAPGNTTRFAELQEERTRLKSNLDEDQKQFAEFQKLEDTSVALWLRRAQCFDTMERKWECVLIYEYLLARSDIQPFRDDILYTLATTWADLYDFTRALTQLDKYTTEFPNGKHLEAANYLQGALLFQTEDYEKTVTFFGSALKKYPKGSFNEKILYLLANARFSLREYDKAEKHYQDYLREYPRGTWREEVDYRQTLCSFFLGNYEVALEKFNSYITRYPQGVFASDAEYRMGVCYFAAARNDAAQFDEVIRRCLEWEKKYPNDSLTGEVLALLGDAYRDQEKKDVDTKTLAINAYRRAVDLTQSPQVLNYALFEANKLLVKKGDWEQIGAMFEKFVKDRPDHPTTVAALYWLGRAKARLGKVDEAKQLQADTIKKHIANRDRDAVEQLLAQLAQLCSKRPRVKFVEPVATPTPVGVAVATPEPTPTPTPPPYDALVELSKYLKESDYPSSPLVKARIAYTHAELATLTKRTEQRPIFLKTVAEQKPAVLSATLLGIGGDFLLETGNLDQARRFYDELKSAFPKSDMIDFAYNGLGEIAFRKADYKGALAVFEEAINEVGAAAKLKEITIGRAKCLLALGRYKDAKEAFEAIAKERSWRGEATALSVYSLGEIEERQGNLKEAIQFYQRVFVSYRKYLPWVAKAYLKSADCFAKLNDTKSAAQHYRELLANEKLNALPEAEIAKKRLAEIEPQ